MRHIYAGIDIETTGTDHRTHGLIQIGIHTEDQFQFVMDVNPGPVEIQDEAMAVNGFTLERIAAARSTEVADHVLRDSLAEFYGSEAVRLIAVGWNVGTFDLPFITKALPLSSKWISYRAVDLNSVVFTLDRARKGVKGVLRYDGLKKHAKRYAAEVLTAKGVPEAWHDALYDARAGLLAWEWLTKKVMVND